MKCYIPSTIHKKTFEVKMTVVVYDRTEGRRPQNAFKEVVDRNFEGFIYKSLFTKLKVTTYECKEIPDQATTNRPEESQGMEQTSEAGHQGVPRDSLTETRSRVGEAEEETRETTEENSWSH